MTNLEKCIIEQADKLKTALKEQVKKDEDYSGVCWYWNPIEERYISTEHSYLTHRFCNEPLFKSKESARKFRSVRMELHRLISIEIQENIEHSLSDLEKNIGCKFVDDWRNFCWYSKE